MKKRILVVIIVSLGVLLSCSGNEPESNQSRIVKKGDGYVVQTYINWSGWRDLCSGEERTLKRAINLKKRIDVQEPIVVANESEEG